MQQRCRSHIDICSHSCSCKDVIAYPPVLCCMPHGNMGHAMMISRAAHLLLLRLAMQQYVERLPGLPLPVQCHGAWEPPKPRSGSDVRSDASRSGP